MHTNLMDMHVIDKLFALLNITSLSSEAVKQMEMLTIFSYTNNPKLPTEDGTK